MDLWNSYRDYRLAVIAEIVKSTGWSDRDAADVAGDVDEAMAEGMLPQSAANEIIAAHANASPNGDR